MSQLIYVFMRKIFLCSIFSICSWSIPFIIRLFSDAEFLVLRTSYLFNNNDNWFFNNSQFEKIDMFFHILKANLTCCIINILGGVVLGISTFINLVSNGFLSAMVFRDVFDNGIPISGILATTLPHCFEMLGIWLSGGLGFYITLNMIKLLRGKVETIDFPMKKFLILCGLVVIIIILAAYVEVYVSLENAKQ